MGRSPLSRRRFLQRTFGTTVLAGFGLGARVSADEFKLATRLEDAPASHPLLPALKLAHQSLQAIEQIQDYECLFLKTELVGDQVVSSKMNLKFRNEPFSVYLKFLSPSAGREVIYVAGQNNNELLVHETGIASLVGTVKLNPTGKYAMEDNRHPITSLGMRLMIESLMQEWLNQTKLDQIVVNFYPNAKIGELSCQAVEVSLPARREGTPFQMTRLYVDKKSLLPVRLQRYGFAVRNGAAGPLMEDYTYLQVRANIGLTNVDFDARNPRYGF